ncbi:hypothetical protein HDV00_008720 [Rhizophlyctis rosea]|nr:hypothetical protein HDV00_008720 [Rhizophlyctis rosea]
MVAVVDTVVEIQREQPAVTTSTELAVTWPEASSSEPGRVNGREVEGGEGVVKDMLEPSVSSSASTSPPTATVTVTAVSAPLKRPMRSNAPCNKVVRPKTSWNAIKKPVGGVGVVVGEEGEDDMLDLPELSSVEVSVPVVGEYVATTASATPVSASA